MTPEREALAQAIKDAWELADSDFIHRESPRAMAVVIEACLPGNKDKQYHPFVWGWGGIFRLIGNCQMHWPDREIYVAYAVTNEARWATRPPDSLDTAALERLAREGGQPGMGALIELINRDEE